MSKNQHGGSRPVTRKDDGRLKGHNKGKYPLQIIKIACTTDELQRIYDSLTTRQRTEAMLKEIERIEK